MYSILDVETTGGKFNEEGITEIAIYRFDGEKIVDQFISLINPEIPIQPFVQQLTGINNKMLNNAPKFFQIAKRILEITENSVLVAHNSSFDYRMLKIEFDRLGYQFNISQLCTVKLSKKIIPNLNSYKLGNLVKSLGIPISNRHRASGDALATVELFKLLLLKDKEKVIVSSLITETKLSSKNKWQKLINKLPNDVGIYYFHDQNGKIIYIGKSNNLKNRVNQHLTGKSKKSLNIQLEVFDITFERTGSELIALLKENTEIKKHKPKFNKLLKKIIKKFCLELCENSDGDKYLRICHYDDTVNYLECYSSLKTANNRLEFFRKKYELSDSPKNNNLNINILINDLNYKFKNMLLVDKGRDIDEKSVIVIKNNNYIGYGFFTLNHQISNFDVLDSLIVKNEYIENSKEVILKYLKKNKIEKLITFD